MKTSNSILSASCQSYCVILAFSCLSITAATHAAETSDTAWGNTPGLTEPHSDSKDRAGYWWWPKPEAGAEFKKRQSGNSGRVFGAWERDIPKIRSEQVTPEDKSNAEDRRMSQYTHIDYLYPNILFPFDSVVYSERSIQDVERYIETMKRAPDRTATCTGHTDNVGSEDYNWALGLRRAQSVVDYMVSRGIDSTRLKVKSKGERDPIAPNDTGANRAMNRRVEIDLWPGP